MCWACKRWCKVNAARDGACSYTYGPNFSKNMPLAERWPPKVTTVRPLQTNSSFLGPDQPKVSTFLCKKKNAVTVGNYLKCMELKHVVTRWWLVIDQRGKVWWYAGVPQLWKGEQSQKDHKVQLHSFNDLLSLTCFSDYHTSFSFSMLPTYSQKSWGSLRNN